MLILALILKWVLLAAFAVFVLLPAIGIGLIIGYWIIKTLFSKKESVCPCCAWQHADDEDDEDELSSPPSLRVIS